MMKTQTPLGPMIAGVAAIVGVAIAAYNYITPLTGINGTPGAMLVIISSALIIIDALILWFGPPGVIFGLFWVLGILGAVGTFAAAWFLHAWLLMAASVVMLLGVVAAIFPSRNTSTKGAYS